MALTLMPAPWFTGLDLNGVSLAGGKAYFYAAGTSTPLSTFSDVGGTTAHPHPVVLDGAGRATIFFSAASYKLSLFDANDVLIRTQDNISAVPATTVDLDIDGTAGEAIAAGQAVHLSDGSGGEIAGRWYLTDADTAAKSSTAGMVGIAPAAISSGASGSIRLQGRVTGLTSLAAGSTYFVSATSGALTASAPTNRRFVGVADSTTSLVLTPSNNEISALRAGGIGVASQAANDLIIAASASQFGRLATGTGVLAASGGAPAYTATPALSNIQFPIAQVASADVNNFDDYEEGNWTPVIGGSGGTSGQTYSQQVGRYIKIGKLVWASYYAQFSAKGTITGNVEIQGLPFVAANVANLLSPNYVVFEALATNWIAIHNYVTINATTAVVRGITAAAVGNNTALATADISNTTILIGTIIYQATA